METPFAAYTGDQPYVFVCYAHDDSDVVYPEMVWLRDQGVNLWYDEGISAGKNWRTVIGDSLFSATHVLFYVSTGSLESDHCNREINLALDEGKNVIPVYIEDVELTTDLKVGLNRVQSLKREQNANYRAHLLSSIGQSITSTQAQAVPKKSRNRFPLHVGIGSLLILFAAGWWYLTQTVEVQTPAEVVTEASVSDIAEPGSTSIAVLPFTNMSNDPEQEFFSDGIAEDILNELAKSTTLTVRSRSSSFSLKGQSIDLKSIGKRLNVTHVLEGSVQRSGERIRVTVQLSEVGSNRTIWSDQFDRPMVDIFVLQDDISSKIMSALSIQFKTGKRRSFASVDAYEAFLKGRDHSNRGAESDEARFWLKEAVRLDPANIDAWTLLVRLTWNLIYNTPQAKQLRPQLQVYLDKMEALDPSHPNLLAAKASIAISEEREYQSSINTLVRLANLYPNNLAVCRNLWEGFIALRRFDLGARTMQHVVSLDPLSPASRGGYVSALLAAGELELAKSELVELEKIRPSVARWTSMEVVLSTGDLVTLENEIARGRAAIGNNSFYVRREALLRRLQGDTAGAATLLADLANTSSPVSSDYGGLSYSDQQEAALIQGRIDDALHFFEKAMAAAEQQAIFGTYGGYYAFRKYFPEYYSDPRYIKILEKYHSDDASLAKVVVPELLF